MQYDYSKRALYHPEERPVFVGFSPNLSFEDDNWRFSLINAWWLSNASHLAYYDEEKIKHELQKVELQLVEYFDIESTQGFLAKGANLALLAFRGTQVEDNKNWNPNSVKNVLMAFSSYHVFKTHNVKKS